MEDGEDLASLGSYNDNHKFTGKEDDNDGLYYFGARCYYPSLGRFTTPEPLGLFEKESPITINPYIYCSDNPLKYIDPDGKWYVKVINGVYYAGTMTPEAGFAKDICEAMPLYETVDNIVRLSEGDITIDKTNMVLEAIYDIASLPIPDEYGVGALYDNLEKISATDAYDKLSNKQKAEIVPAIFREYSEAKGGHLIFEEGYLYLKEKKNMEKVRMNIKDLRQISNKHAEEKIKKDNPYDKAY